MSDGIRLAVAWLVRVATLLALTVGVWAALSGTILIAMAPVTWDWSWALALAGFVLSPPAWYIGERAGLEIRRQAANRRVPRGFEVVGLTDANVRSAK